MAGIELNGLSESLSVVMPVRNGAKFLSRSLNSTLKNMSRNDRLLIWDDGSTDNSIDQLEAFAEKDDRVKVWASKQQLGVASALNRLLERVETPLVARMDCDDIVFQGRFKAQREALKWCDFHFMNAYVFKSKFTVGFGLPNVPSSLPPAAAPLSLVTTNPFVHSSAAYRIEKTNSLGGYVNTPGQDYDLWLRAAQHNFILTKSASVGVGYRLHGQQVSRLYALGRRLNELDPNLVEQRLRLAGHLGLDGCDLSTAVLQARMELRKISIFYQFRRWAP